MTRLQAFGPNLWLASGDAVRVAGFEYPTRMAIIRLQSGGLVLWSPVADADVLQEVADLGAAHAGVQHILAPNHLHHLALPHWIDAFPNALVHAAPQLRLKRRDLAFGSDLGTTPHPDWAGQIDQVVMHGNAITTEVILHHKDSRTVLIADLLQQFEPGFHTGWRAVVARLDRMVGPRPQMPRKFRLAFRDRSAARQATRDMLAWNAKRLVVAHGAPISDGATALLRTEFGFLA